MKYVICRSLLNSLMKSLRHLFLFSIISLVGAFQAYAQGDRCSGIQAFCAGTSQYVFPNSNADKGNFLNAEIGPDYLCLERQLYPSWFYLKVDSSGKLDFLIKQTQNSDGSGRELDVDFIAWGPFGERDDLCSSSSLSNSRIVDCSYSTSATENLVIDNAIAGQVYVVLLTNYSELPGYISLEQINLNQSASGTTDCSIVNILGDDIARCDNSPVLLNANKVIASRFEYYVFNEISNSFELLSNQISPEFMVFNSGLYKVIAINESTGLRLDDEILVEYLEAPIAKKPEDLFVCSNGDTGIFDLSDVNAILTQDSDNPRVDYEVSFYGSQQNFENEIIIESPDSFQGFDGQKIIATITDPRTSCVSNLVDFNLFFSPMPIMSFPETIEFCVSAEGDLIETKTLGSDFGSDFIYRWNVPNDPDGDGVQNSILIVNEIFDFPEISLEIENKQTGCSSSFRSQIKYYSAPKNITVTISGNDFEDGYLVDAATTGFIEDSATFEYQLDGGAWQNSSSFADVKPGRHIISSRDEKGCGIASSTSFNLVGYARFFTPNGDGYNDTWNVTNDEQVSISKILIYNRYGKLLKQLDPRGSGWDGTNDGKSMPADDYWFVVDLRDKSTGVISEFSGHFTLKL